MNGYLSVHSFTSAACIPVEGVTFTITQRRAQGVELLAVRIADESGRIAPVAIAAPDEAESQSPGTPRPFAVVDITADHPEFERILVENVQIFANITTDQNFALIPLAEQPEVWNMTEVFTIPAQEL